MGYACPVCSDPQADGEHLANHLAFTALLGDADHEAWLDQNAPEWESLDPPALADRVVGSVPETEFPEVFEDTVPDERRGEAHGRAHDHGHGRGDAGQATAPEHDGPVRADRDSLDDEARAILDRARKLTEQRRDDGDHDERGSDGQQADDDRADEPETE
jgi:hypothetical protein